MQYRSNTKLVIDKRKLDVLIRLNCPDEQLLQVIKTGQFTPTGDKLLDDTLECLVDIKEFDNWGGKRQGAGRKKNQDENHLDNQLENQDANQVVDIDIDNNINNNIFNTSAYKALKAWGGLGKADKVKITQQFNIFEVEHPQLKQMLELYGEKIAVDIQTWLRRTKRGEFVEKDFILSLFYKFYERENQNEKGKE